MQLLFLLLLLPLAFSFSIHPSSLSPTALRGSATSHIFGDGDPNHVPSTLQKITAGKNKKIVDNASFSVSPKRWPWHPQQRLLLERGCSSLHDASYDRTSLGGSSSGVFLGILIDSSKKRFFTLIANSSPTSTEREASTPSNHPDPLLLQKLKHLHSTLGPPLLLSSKILSQSPSMSLAAEFKRASPSKGQIATSDISAGDQACIYFDSGSSVISVLTEPTYFKGSLDDMYEARVKTQELSTKLNTERPCILRKDFITSKHMILEAAAYGADTVLLIVAVTRRDDLKVLIEYCRELGMEPLVEIHAESELSVAVEAGAKVLGVNNR
ncbi:hypothetical protein TL16_g01833 [Triparma laevis f. inornata]|uniref:indole-3-glycerol-phosphate synthase n=1 Tax=Triparma laevis f. inornata TaxID=1714386 RepID=A0A9W6ZQ83_9STRA|nr:hypothetical protein TL16_g01833 [Triparma laevis f. inornata]